MIPDVTPNGVFYLPPTGWLTSFYNPPEILDAVRGAFEQNMLIVGFDETLHEPQFVTPQNTFKVNEVQKMSRHIMTALLKPSLMKELIDTQRQLASEVSVQDYQRMIGALQSE